MSRYFSEFAGHSLNSRGTVITKQSRKSTTVDYTPVIDTAKQGNARVEKGDRIR